jgi:NADH-quinone oxidoreductase subunit M
MTVWDIPWLEVGVAVALLGSLWVSPLREPIRAFRWGLVFTGATLGCALLAWFAHEAGMPPDGAWSVQPALFGRQLFAVDALTAPLVALVALLHFLTALATGRTIMRSFSLSWSLATLALRLTIFSCAESWLLVALLAAEAVLPLVELHNRGQSTRVYVLHMILFVGLMGLGWAQLNPAGRSEDQPALATVLLLAAVLIRCGAVPAHCWVTDWFEHASFGNALLFMTPLVGVYAAVRLVVPFAPDGMLTALGIFALATAVYAAGMALVQRQPRRLFAFLFLSHSSLVLVGLAVHTLLGVTAALALGVAVPLSLAGFGLTLRALEARFGRLSLADFHGLYDNSPALAVCFALTGLAAVGFPGTLGFVATEMLVDGAVEASPWAGLAVVVAAALNGIAVVRAYFRLFTGTRHPSTVSLRLGPRERFAVLTLAALILGGGLFPQPGVVSRYRAAEDVLHERTGRAPPAQASGGFSVVRGSPPVIFVSGGSPAHPGRQTGPATPAGMDRPE